MTANLALPQGHGVLVYGRDEPAAATELVMSSDGTLQNRNGQGAAARDCTGHRARWQTTVIFWYLARLNKSFSESRHSFGSLMMAHDLCSVHTSSHRGSMSLDPSFAGGTALGGASHRVCRTDSWEGNQSTGRVPAMDSCNHPRRVTASAPWPCVPKQAKPGFRTRGVLIDVVRHTPFQDV